MGWDGLGEVEGNIEGEKRKRRRKKDKRKRKGKEGEEGKGEIGKIREPQGETSFILNWRFSTSTR